MAGGTFLSQNKIRPGAYINFKAVNTPSIKVGSRGIVTFGVDLDWGKEGELIDVYSNDLISGDSLKKVGLTVLDDNALLFKMALSNAYLAKVYRLNVGGAKATATLGNLTVTAKCSGTFGNKIAVISKEVASGSGIFQVSTYADGYLVDNQKASTIGDLVDNDYVEFIGDGDEDVTAFVSTLLTGGTNGTTAPATAYPAYFNILKTAQWQTLAIVQNSEVANALASTFIHSMREDEGKYVQVVLANYNVANYEGIINNISSIKAGDVTVSADKFNAWVAGATAGASLVESNTGKLVDVATQIVDPLGNEQIIEALNLGKFVLSTNQDGTIKVEKDINSLHAPFAQDRGYSFSKNKVIRVLDDIGTAIKNIWETTYLGKVNNNDNGRMLFRSSIINYLTELQNIEAITDFNADNVEVVQGNDIDSVVANIAIKPVDAMEILYMTVNVED